MSLNSQQQRNARLIYQAGVHAGLAPNRALELVAAAYAESGLNERIKNRQGSGAAGLFQLLSPGYVNKANQMGGVFNPEANIHAILPDYVSYWRSHPNATPGEAAAAVERSGMGPSFYAAPLRVVSGINRNAPLTMPAAATKTVGYPQPNQISQSQTTGIGLPDYHLAQMQMAQALIQSSAQTQRGQHADIPSLLDSLTMYENEMKQPYMQQVTQQNPQLTQTPQVPAPAPADTGVPTGPATGKPGKLDTRLVALAHRYGLSITSGYRTPAQNAAVGGAEHSYHMRGEAIDVLPSEKAKAFYKYALAHPSLFTELFYDPAGIYIKNGHLVRGQIGGHSDHIHIVLAGSGGPA